MLKTFKFRIYPTADQKVLINKHIGATRFVYNLSLEVKQMAWSGSKIDLSCFDLHNQLPDLKKECPWLKEINSQSLQQSITNLDKAYSSFFKGQQNFPRFKSKSNTGSFHIPQSIYLNGDLLVIPKFQEGIQIRLHRPIKGSIRRATVTRTPTEKFFISILCETGEALPEKISATEQNTIGIDLGIKNFLSGSDGSYIENPKFLNKSTSKLNYALRKQSKYHGKQSRKRIVHLHERVANQRRDFLQKTSTRLIKSHDSVAIEDLGISNMLKNHKLARSIGDAGWGIFITMLNYKADWYGKSILKIGRFDASSKICSYCGNINKNLTLNDRTWTCQGCSTVLDRDLNAAINIKNFSLKNILSGVDRKICGELPTLVGAMTHKASATHQCHQPAVYILLPVI